MRGLRSYPISTYRARRSRLSTGSDTWSDPDWANDDTLDFEQDYFPGAGVDDESAGECEGPSKRLPLPPRVFNARKAGVKSTDYARDFMTEIREACETYDWLEQWTAESPLGKPPLSARSDISASAEQHRISHNHALLDAVEGGIEGYAMTDSSDGEDDEHWPDIETWDGDWNQGNVRLSPRRAQRLSPGRALPMPPRPSGPPVPAGMIPSLSGAAGLGAEAAGVISSLSGAAGVGDGVANTVVEGAGKLWRDVGAAAMWVEQQMAPTASLANPFSGAASVLEGAMGVSRFMANGSSGLIRARKFSTSSPTQLTRRRRTTGDISSGPPALAALVATDAPPSGEATKEEMISKLEEKQALVMMQLHAAMETSGIAGIEELVQLVQGLNKSSLELARAPPHESVGTLTEELDEMRKERMQLQEELRRTQEALKRMEDLRGAVTAQVGHFIKDGDHPVLPNSIEGLGRFAPIPERPDAGHAGHLSAPVVDASALYTPREPQVLPEGSVMKAVLEVQGKGQSVPPMQGKGQSVPPIKIPKGSDGTSSKGNDSKGTDSKGTGSKGTGSKGTEPAQGQEPGGKAQDEAPKGKGKGKGKAPPPAAKSAAAPKGAGKAKADKKNAASALPLGKKWHWKPVKEAELPGTVFEQIVPADLLARAGSAPVAGEPLSDDAWRVDADVMKMIFLAAEGTATMGTKSVKIAKTEIVIFDSGRARNLQIGLKSLHKQCPVSMSMLADVLRRLDAANDAVANIEVLELLATVLPSPEEVSKLTSVPEEQLPDLRDCERHIWEIARVPRLPQRVRLVFFMRKLSELEEDVTRRLEAIRCAARAARDCEGIRDFLGVCLCIGNYINAGWSAEDASKAVANGTESGDTAPQRPPLPVAGFKIESLVALRDFQASKAIGGGISLLHVALLHHARLLGDSSDKKLGAPDGTPPPIEREACRVERAASPGLGLLRDWHSKLMTELEPLLEAANDSLASIEADIGELRGEAAFIDGEVRLSETSKAYDGDASQALRAIAENSSKCMAKLDENLESVRDTCRQLVAYYADGTCRKPTEISDKVQTLMKTLTIIVRKLLAQGIDKLCDKKRPVQALPAPEGLFRPFPRGSVSSVKSAENDQSEVAANCAGSTRTPNGSWSHRSFSGVTADP